MTNCTPPGLFPSVKTGKVEAYFSGGMPRALEERFIALFKKPLQLNKMAGMYYK